MTTTIEVLVRRAETAARLNRTLAIRRAELESTPNNEVEPYLVLADMIEDDLVKLPCSENISFADISDVAHDAAVKELL